MFFKSPEAQSGQSGGPPFVLEIRQEDLKPNGDFTPAAAVLVTESLRQSGLLGHLSAEDFQTLLLVLSCVTANGSFVSTPELLAPIARVSVRQMRIRLQRLAMVFWLERPLVAAQLTEKGQQFFSPSPHLLETRHSTLIPTQELKRGGAGLASETPTLQQRSSREAVIAYSRATYGRPRAEVEAQIERFLRGETEPATPEEAARLTLRRKLLDKGLMQEQADRLLDNYSPEAVERQLLWLPYRYARNPAGLLISAIEGDYEAPLAWIRASAKETLAPHAEAENTTNPAPEIDE